MLATSDVFARLPYLRLTTISQDTRRLAALAVQRAIDRLEGRPVSERDVVLEPHLVIRDTTAARRPDHRGMGQ